MQKFHQNSLSFSLCPRCVCLATYRCVFCLLLDKYTIEIVSNMCILDLDCSGRLHVGVELCNLGLLYKGTRVAKID
jgi:hypothetical protein